MYGSLIKYLETNSGMELTTLTNICRLFDALLTEKSRGYRLPSWAQDVMIPGGEFERLTLHGYEQWAAMPELKKIRSGFLLKDILDRFANKSQSNLLPDRSLWMYFAHDLTIVNLLQSMDMFTRKLVPTVSCLFFELYQSDEGHYVQIFYKNSTEENLPAMEIPKCGTKCPLNKMFELFSNILPKNSYEEECRLRYDESLPPGGNPENFEL